MKTHHNQNKYIKTQWWCRWKTCVI